MIAPGDTPRVAIPAMRSMLSCYPTRFTWRPIPDESSPAPLFRAKFPTPQWRSSFESDNPGVALPELVQWLPAAALDEPIGNIGANAPVTQRLS